MKEEIEGFIIKSERSLKTAESLFVSEDFDFAVSRAYYAMFYMAEACLLTKSLSFSKHSGVISAFNQHFVKTGIFGKEYFRILQFAFDQRQIGDYEAIQNVSKEIAQRIIHDAKIFFATTKEYLINYIKS
jgi:uncharacterized protein (UPF0332 family)